MNIKVLSVKRSIVYEMLLLGGLLISPVMYAAEISNFTLVSQTTGISQDTMHAFGNPIWGDINNDDFLDIIVPGHGSGPDIYLNDGNGSFIQQRLRNTFFPTIFQEHNDKHGFSFTDYDNDGNLDLFVTLGGKRGEPGFTKRDLLYSGNGDGTFINISTEAGVENASGRGRSACWFDYDNDGNLDLFIKNIGTKNKLYMNSNAHNFIDVAAVVGLADIEGSTCSLVDYNNDGRLDLFVTSINGKIWLLKNDTNGTFVDMSTAANLGHEPFSRGNAWGDYNNDGYIDLYIAKGYSGNIPNNITRLANTLYLNNGDGSFTDVTVAAGVDAGYNNTTTAAWGDIDNDGWLDLFVTNAGDLSGVGNKNFLYLNQGNGTFTEIALEAGIQGQDNLKEHRYSMVSLADYDNDGFLDVALKSGVDEKGFTELYHNEGTSNSFLKIKLEGIQANKLGIGSKVKLTTSQGSQYRQYTGTEGAFFSQSIQPLHFGLGNVTTAAIEVVWPNGYTQVIENVAVNQTITIVEKRPISLYRPTIDELGFYVWRHPSNGEWEIRWIGDETGKAAFSGRITSDGTFTSVNTVRFERNDTVTWDTDAIIFSGFAKNRLDGLHFITTGSMLTFELLQDGAEQPQFVHIGGKRVVPGYLPVTLD